MPIVCATPADIPALTKLVNSAYRGEEGWTNESHLMNGTRTNEAGVAELLQQSDSMILKYVGLEDDAQAGRVGMGSEVTQAELTEIPAGCVYLQKQGDVLYLGMLSVDPARQGNGIGKDLLEASIVYARELGCVKIRITVISLRSELIAWYERHGYRRTGEVEPFHAGEKFGIQKQPFELVVLEKQIAEA